MSSESGFQQTLITLSKAAIRYQKQVCCCSQASSSSDTWPHVAFCILKLVVGCCSSHLGQKQVKALIHDLNYKDISGLSWVTAAFSNLAKLLLKSWIAKYSFVWWQYQSQLVKEDHDKQGKKKKKEWEAVIYQIYFLLWSSIFASSYFLNLVRFSKDTVVWGPFWRVARQSQRHKWRRRGGARRTP